MERIFKIIIFLILLVCLVMTIRLFAIGGVVADEYGLSGATIYGGKNRPLYGLGTDVPAADRFFPGISPHF
jgi:hypothetical protein